MKYLKPAQYVFMTNPNGSWTIFENTDEGSLDYECEYEDYNEAYFNLQQIKWLEQTYSPPRT